MCSSDVCVCACIWSTLTCLARPYVSRPAHIYISLHLHLVLLVLHLIDKFQESDWDSANFIPPLSSSNVLFDPLLALLALLVFRFILQASITTGGFTK